MRTTAGTLASEPVVVRTHKLTDLSGVTITTGILPSAARDAVTAAVSRVGARLVDDVRIDTTHFITTEGRGLAWEKAVETNIPVVRPEWIEACERAGRIIGVTKYYLDALRPGPSPEDLSPHQLPHHQSASVAHKPLAERPADAVRQRQPSSATANSATPTDTESSRPSDARDVAPTEHEQKVLSPQPDDQKFRLDDRPVNDQKALKRVSGNGNESEEDDDVVEAKQDGGRRNDGAAVEALSTEATATGASSDGASFKDVAL